jgi:hypothetical protein
LYSFSTPIALSPKTHGSPDGGVSKAISIAKDAPICVVSPFHVGPKVTVTSGPLAGKVGWMLANRLFLTARLGMEFPRLCDYDGGAKTMPRAAE